MHRGRIKKFDVVILENMTTPKKLWIGIGILALLSPLGLILPSLFGAGGAWGEWGAEEFHKLIGYVPEGMHKLARLWKSPLKDYAVPGQTQGLARRGLGYVLTAFIGVAITAGAAYLIAKALGRKSRGK